MSVLKRYTGAGWEDITSGNLLLQGGMTGSLISEQTLSADASTVTFSGLDSLIDGDYQLEVSWIGGSVTGTANFQVNGDSTEANYYRQQVSGSSSNAGADRGNSNDMLYCPANKIATGSFKITVTDGYVRLIGGYGYGDTATMDIIYLVCGKVAQVTSITSIALAAQQTNGFKAGSTFRLYGSKTPTQLISYSPIDYSTFAGDRLLNAGEVAYIDYSGTGAFSVPLNIQSEEGIYELSIEGDMSIVAGSDTGVFIRPNNANSTTVWVNGFYKEFASSTMGYANVVGTTNAGFPISGGAVYRCKATIHTTTKNKIIKSDSFYRANSATFQIDYNLFWKGAGTPSTTNINADTTATWTSLGTIDFPCTQNGRIVVRRII